jgi:predicted CXXCH cytochrome family protein
MSKLKIGLSAVFMIILLSLFGAVAFAEAPTSTNPATGVNVGDIDNFGDQATHRTHGNFQNNTNSCANCHSTHNAQDNMLLMKSSEYDLCMSCHDGTMGFYDVTKGSGAGTFSESHESASMHKVNAGVEIGSAPGAAVNTSTDALECSSCHNPHGSANDRLLSETVLGEAYGYLYTGKWKDSAHSAVSYTKGDLAPVGTQTIKLQLTEDPAYAELNGITGDKGLKIYKSNGPDGDRDRMNYSSFCAGCHDNYYASRTAKKPNLDNGGKEEGVYTHTTNGHKAGRNCASCHYAHGTDINTLKDSSGRTISELQKSVADGGLGFTESTAKAYMKDINAKGSSIKKFTNMSVCFSCHGAEGLGGPNAAGQDTSGAPDTADHYYTDENGDEWQWDRDGVLTKGWQPE